MSVERLRQEIDALGDAEWTGWPHAYGTARDTADHLSALAGTDAAAQFAAARHYSSAIVHQSSVWPASPDAFDWLVRVLRVAPLSANVLDECLGALAEAAEYLGDIETGTPVPELSRAARAWLAKFAVTPDDDHELLWDVDETVGEEVYQWVLIRLAALRPAVARLVTELAEQAPQACGRVREAWSTE
ncbi:MAG: hypothetical protein ABW215_12935 [Kibdelosporangium sp.]